MVACGIDLWTVQTCKAVGETTGTYGERVYGIIKYSIFQGAFTAELFIEFIEFVEEKVLPHCNPYPGDNASIHKNNRLQELCDEHGVLLKFLPPYSPD